MGLDEGFEFESVLEGFDYLSERFWENPSDPVVANFISGHRAAITAESSTMGQYLAFQDYTRILRQITSDWETSQV